MKFFSLVALLFALASAAPIPTPAGGSDANSVVPSNDQLPAKTYEDFLRVYKNWWSFQNPDRPDLKKREVPEFPAKTYEDFLHLKKRESSEVKEPVLKTDKDKEDYHHFLEFYVMNVPFNSTAAQTNITAHFED
ncbi:P-factor pheromone Map2 [Schizosaccharomyces cryophilus OY26]|uniref:p-factor pheromone Map2 n=1 Tax=Schizosaccharomyces cryophilus (strain OY26 / ATCC MYA-4695 / CBS 11777 / NBRC 106824 / NRRL Y48691) TaxID=653667 RepID=S9VU92_SCHCR|nr:P-factor pheromone Map2 [Schizosaccharomyces cryophilus OY26]EPY49749.1 P-factor pheromone Map2 [Schizosaccharomyces cryophilus OY26]